jgi:hypothetical protein
MRCSCCYTHTPPTNDHTYTSLTNGYADAPATRHRHRKDNVH